MWNWVAILSAVLQLALAISKRAGDAKTEKAITDAILVAQGVRLARAAAARDAVGKLPVGKDPNDRDG